MRSFVTVLMGLALAFLAGCQSGELATPRRYYVIDCQRPERLPSPGDMPVLKINPFVAVPLCDRNRIVLRRSETQYESDFYDLYLNEPAVQMTSLTRGWLADCGLFAAVITPRSTLPADFELTATVERLEVDLTGKASPKAIIALRVLVTRSDYKTTRVVLNRLYTVRQEVASKSVDRIVTAFGQGLGILLAELEAHLSAAGLETKARATVLESGGNTEK